jgi:uncharacterized protein
VELAIRPIFVVAIGLSLVSAGRALAQANTGSGPPAINVSGTAEMQITPDEVDLRFGIHTRSDSLDDAKKQNHERLATTVRFLKASGIDPRDIQSDHLSIEPIYDEKEPLKLQAYVARRSIGVRLRNIADFEKVLSGGFKEGANSVYGVEFRTTQLRKHRDTARQLAIRAAKEKATALASELGAKIGKVQSISENTLGGSSWLFGYNRLSNVMQSEPSPPDNELSGLSVGQISISASVNVTFLLD